jgi:hypothetical protein
MNQKSQRRFVGPMEVSRTSNCGRIRAVRPSVSEMLSKRKRRLRVGGSSSGSGISGYPSKSRRNLRQLGRVVANHLTAVVEARGVSEATFNDFDKRKMRKGFVCLVAMADEAAKANAPRVVRDIHRQASPAHAGFTPEHDQ